MEMISTPLPHTSAIITSPASVSYTHLVGQVESAMLRCAREKYILCDSTKLNQTTLCTFISVSYTHLDVYKRQEKFRRYHL